MKKSSFVFSVLVLGVIPHVQASGPHWSYADTEQWGSLSPKFSECRLGKNQSPIDIQTNQVQVKNLAPIKTTYKASSAEVINNGHTIQVALNDVGNAVVPSGSYKLLQFHFHTPS